MAAAVPRAHYGPDGVTGPRLDRSRSTERQRDPRRVAQVPLSEGLLRSVATGLLDPTRLINTFGLLGMMAIVFAECGLLVWFFLPGIRCCSPAVCWSPAG
ncbi:hypothetical protein GCM10010531_17330 [Blastococcus jejuensis]|uniref:Uncharacterized protein n=1 Tax=Blastococcus jejuensis TaxID=351224 RepID=A0ABP6P2I4_9ACTN